MNHAIHAHGQRMAQAFLCAGTAERHGNDLGGLAGFLEAQGFLDGIFIEGIDAHLHACGFDSQAVGTRTYANVVINHPLEGDQNFH